ncbi:hypothetical protein AVEN_44045-1 [Araneus ventricosus]|uniref:Uncharacterized protein n=1 Tax=Araneus ventricosus TaxID=182803 RepID=A0A4Y2H7H1_ARAVE|nr:hypothetical protein AVEN_44045-1 [Araneus ventricosus]
MSPVPWTRELILLGTGHGPFPSYLRRFNRHYTDRWACVEVGSPLHYATSCQLTASYHFTKPRYLTTIWWQNLLNNKLSRTKIITFISFLTEHENLIKSQQDHSNSTKQDSFSDSDSASPSTRQTRSQ